MQTDREEQQAAPEPAPTPVHDGLTCDEVEAERRRVAALFVAEYLRQKEDAELRNDLVDARIAAEVQTYQRWSDRAKAEAAERRADEAERRAAQLAFELDKALGRLREERAMVDKWLAESKALLDQFDADTRKYSRRLWIYTALFAVAVVTVLLLILTASPHPT